MGQFSMEISGHAGSVLSGNQHADETRDVFGRIGKRAGADRLTLAEEGQVRTEACSWRRSPYAVTAGAAVKRKERLALVPTGSVATACACRQAK